MLIDRILEDALGFIRRLLWWRSGTDKSIRKPFRSMQVVHGEFGLISLVIGRDTPRAVRSWIYSPKRCDLNSTNPVVRKPCDDLHIYLDFLGPLPSTDLEQLQAEGRDRRRRRKQGDRLPTHRVQVLRASHFLNENGFYDYELIFWTDFDFYWPTVLRPDTAARQAIDRLAYRCLRVVNVFDLSADDWALMLQEIWQEVRGG
jgi:hypothetical protein